MLPSSTHLHGGALEDAGPRVLHADDLLEVAVPHLVAPPPPVGPDQPSRGELAPWQVGHEVEPAALPRPPAPGGPGQLAADDAQGRGVLGAPVERTDRVEPGLAVEAPAYVGLVRPGPRGRRPRAHEHALERDVEASVGDVPLAEQPHHVVVLHADYEPVARLGEVAERVVAVEVAVPQPERLEARAVRRVRGRRPVDELAEGADLVLLLRAPWGAAASWTW